ncbi:hypothetical protein BDW74DRAFT_176335 [Aspergillus multicolor]|uniref:glycosyltransferase family 34 protein n=1 Tax=Aspergillus multicolor TaxID=41759 RepID=UPI003CCDE1CC
MLYGARNPLYERALQSHRRHAEGWGYGMEVLQNEIAVGYWNKPSYLLALVVNELSKPIAERVEWIMWVDADSIIINPLIPLEIFLPPSSTSLDSIHFVATKDHKGLNTGIFFLRVHKWSVHFLIESLAYPKYNPYVDLDVQVDQSAMERVLNESSYCGNVTYLPRPWINAYEWKHAYEGERGNMLVHFPGLDGARWEHMRKWLDVVDAGVGGWEVGLEETWYLEGTRGFWERVERARGIIDEYKSRNGTDVKGKEGTVPGEASGRKIEMERAMEELKHVLYEEPYEGDLLQQRIEAWNRISTG